MNGYYGYLDNQQFEQRQSWERARFIVTALVEKPPSFPWDKEQEERQEYTAAEKQAIAEYHDNVQRNAKKVQKLTSEGWIDVDSGS